MLSCPATSSLRAGGTSRSGLNILYSWRLGGQSNREIVSLRPCVRANGRGEAKLRGRARDDVLCVARAPADPVTSSTARRGRLRAGLSRGLSRWLSRRLSRPDGSAPGCPVDCPVGCLVSVSCRVSQVVSQVMNEVVSQIMSQVMSQVNHVSQVSQVSRVI